MGKSDTSDEEITKPEESTAETPKDEIVDAEIVEDIPPKGDVEETAKSDEGSKPDADPDAQPIEDEPSADATNPSTDAAEGEGPKTEGEPVTATSDPIPPAPVVQEKIIERRGSPLGVVFGGLLAGAVGFLGAQYPDEWPFGSGAPTDSVAAALAEQSDALEALTSRVEEVAGSIPAMPEIPEVDLSPVTGVVEDLGGRIDAVQSTLAELDQRATADMTALSDRLTALERAPVEAVVSPEAIASYERELETMREAMAAQRETLTEAMAAQRSEIEKLAAEAVEAEQNANQQAALAAARAAYAELTASLENGGAFVTPLAVVSQAAGTDAPAALAAIAADGVPTQQSLVEAFPAAARSALAAVRQETAGEGGLTGFLMGQLGARSVTPRDGDDPDAVLSRAEAAVRSGDLQTALSEIGALPDAARAALGDWPAQAQARLDALNAAAALGQTLNQQ